MKELWANPEYRKHMQEVHKGQKSACGMLGKHHSKATRLRMSEIHKNIPGQCSWFIGKDPWNKNTKGLIKPNSGSFKEMPEEKHPKWKGDDVGYCGLHLWVRKHLGKPTTCEHCNKTGLTGKKIHWANKSGKYLRDVTDWLRLCAQCHKDYDRENNLIHCWGR